MRTGAGWQLAPGYPSLETQTRALSSLKSDFEADSGLIFCQGLAPAEKKD